MIGVYISQVVQNVFFFVTLTGPPIVDDLDDNTRISTHYWVDRAPNQKGVYICSKHMFCFLYEVLE